MDQRDIGRLELTWANKDRRLLARDDGSYDWLPPTDHRVAEVRLLRDAGSVGETTSGDPTSDSLLIRGDPLYALTALTELPEYAKRYAGKVQLAYLDPPFNTGQAFKHYDDALAHSVWLTMMRDRLVQVRDVLAPTGSVWVHCDDDEGARLRVLMDEIFGSDRWVATVVWQTRTSRENRAAFGRAHNYIHVYSPAGPTAWRDVRNRLARSSGQIRDDGDPRGPWESIPFSAQGHRKNQMYKITTPTGVVHDPPRGRCWGATEPEYQRLLADGRIHFSKGGNGRPRVKQFVADARGLVPMTWWPASDVGDNEEAKKEILELLATEHDAFDHPKPERLLERIVHIASSEGDLVLDCFLGSGTTAAVAHKMGRRWVGVEFDASNLDRYVLPRLTRVVEGTDDGGITESAGWEGGGGFRILDVAPSMFADDEGVVVLADWAVDSDLARATAAQLGYEYEAAAPLCGRRGRSRLAVVDGLVSQVVVEMLVDALDDGEILTVCGTSIEPGVKDRLQELRSGSRVRKIPASLLADYQEASRWQPRIPTDASASKLTDARPEHAATAR